jgi:hypothetical protein
VRKSHIYVLPEYAHGKTTRPPEPNVAYKILDDYYPDLPRGAQIAFDAVRGAMVREQISLRKWAAEFIDAYRSEDPLPSVSFGSTVSVDTSTLKGLEDLSSMGRALFAVAHSGVRGVTSIEARRMGEVGGGISGALTKLNQAGVIVRLEATR